MELISTQSIIKHFGKTPVINEVSIQINQGEIYGFLGLNGAGKTTLIRILLGMIKPNSGHVKLFGKKVTANFNQWNDIGYLVETPYSYPNLSVTENLNVYYQLRQLNNPKVIEDIIGKLKLTPYANTKAKHLSLGNQQRLGLAKALIHKPKLLILDEPINGLDPEGIVEVRELIKELVHTGSTVFLSSHILGEISKVANRIAIIHQGKLIKELTTNELTSQLVKKILVKTNENQRAVTHLITSNYQAALNENDEIEITGSNAISNPEHISKLLVEKGLPPKQVSLFTEDLEMYFLRTIRS
ncbi:MAG TPA: ABC transporter ATP-binding protein [Cyclobacteriaceae bacterium]|nr:ABC transporter ATP-binding protein [Cyclobacteriaceae bacterium]HPW61746.1 ABC transporter ATP-binding protein [Cyclobacteriaceae bacterium]HRG79348.1 ABC transporter ATP-binding protein [Cyclobacteriaceae bacterium]